MIVSCGVRITPMQSSVIKINSSCNSCLCFLLFILTLYYTHNITAKTYGYSTTYSTDIVRTFTDIVEYHSMKLI